MYKTFAILLFSLFFISCSQQKVKPIAANEKVFAQEDAYIMFALQAEEKKDYQSATELFDILYDKSSKKEYLYRSLENMLAAKENEKVISRVDVLLSTMPDDAKLLRYKVIALFDLSRLDEAIALSVALSKKTKEPKDYLLTSDIYIKRQEYDLAVKYLESAYAKEHNEQILDKMSIILYVNLDRKKEAIALLETHSRMLGCSERVCSRLIAFYANDNNLDGLLSTYLRLYEVHKSEAIAKKIIQIYTYKRDYVNLTAFLEKSHMDDALLLELYASTKNYAKAYPLADKLYSETADKNYLGQSAIYEYESAENNITQKLLSRVVEKLEKVTNTQSDPIYLNYLGYILIDHDKDIHKGMSYIDKALKIKPNSAYYLDSKAWGYYKLGECKKAQKMMQKVTALEGGDNPEVKLHVKKIEQCLKQ